MSVSFRSECLKSQNRSVRVELAWSHGAWRMGSKLSEVFEEEVVVGFGVACLQLAKCFLACIAPHQKISS